MKEALKIKIELYLEGKLPPEEVSAFEEQITSDQELKETIEIFKELNHHFSDEQELTEIPINTFTDDLKKFFQSEEAVSIKEKLNKAQDEYNQHSKNSSGWKNYLYVAATITILVLGAWGYFSLTQKKPDTLYKSYYSANDLPSVVQRGEGDNKLIEGVLMFKDGKYEESIRLLNTFEKDISKFNLASSLYLGVAYTEIEKYDEAIFQFDEVITSVSLDASKGLWFKALLFIKKGEIPMARSTLKEILENTENFKYSEAKKLLKEL